MERPETWDVVVIGGGPAGLLAAGRAAMRGAKVVVLEKNETLGKKLLITGGGRCNITNAEPRVRTLLANYKDSSKYLHSPFAHFGVADTLQFFREQGLETKTEPQNRVFPQSNSARSVLQALQKYIQAGRVTVHTETEVSSITHSSTAITRVVTTRGESYHANSYIFATGGKSRPETGSTGDGFTWLSKLGHSVVVPDVSLVPITIKEDWISKAAGVTLPSTGITLLLDEQVITKKQGKILITHVGMSGPTILNMSREIGDALPYGTVTLRLDCFPQLDHGTLDAQLVVLLHTHANKLFKNLLPLLLLPAFARAAMPMFGVPPDTPCHSLTKSDRHKIVHLLKALSLTVSGRLGSDKAIITSGGVPLSEIDSRTMRSTYYSNLYIVGDLLHIDRPSGGFSLQLCWTTGWVAGSSVSIGDTSTA